MINLEQIRFNLPDWFGPTFLITPFNPENKLEPTVADLLDPAMKIIIQEDADQYFEKYSDYIWALINKDGNPKGLSAEKVARNHLVYYAAYHSDEVRARVKKLFKCEYSDLENFKEIEANPYFLEVMRIVTSQKHSDIKH